VAAAICAGLACSQGCSDADPYDKPLALSAPVPVASGVIFHDSAAERLVTVRPADNDRIGSIAYDGSPKTQSATPDGKRLVLHDVQGRTLAIASPADEKATTYDLPAEFSANVVAPDSQAAVVYHGGSTSAASLVNTAEVGLVDFLTAPGETNPRVATITGLARAPIRAHVSAEVEAADGKHRVVWIDAQSMIGVADFAPGGKVRTLVIPLVAVDSKALITPRATVARGGGGKLELYVIAQGSNDVLHITMDLGQAKLGASLDQIASGADPVSLHVFEAKAGRRVLTANHTSRDVAILDPTTGTGTVVHLGTPTTKIVPFENAKGEPMALLWRSGLTDFHLVDLDRVAKKKGKAISRIHVDQPIRNVVAAGASFILQHDSADRGLSLYNTETGKQTVFGGTGTLSHVLKVGDAVFALGRAGGDSRISRISLNDLHPTSIALKNRTTTSLVPFGEAGVAAAGPGLGGWWLALFASGTLKAKDGAWLEGFVLEGVLQ